LPAKTRRELPDYSNPPVVEVVAGLFFPALKELRIPHFGVFWEKVRTDFPTVDHAAPLTPRVTPDMAFSLVDDFGSVLPRIWLISSSGNGLLQLQRDAFFFNWRKQAATDAYPHFESVFSEFSRYYTLFCTFLQESNIAQPNPSEIELSYVNHVPQNQLWKDYSDIGNVLRDFTWRSDNHTFLPVPVSHSHTLQFSIPNTPAHLRATIQSAARQPDQNRIIRIDLSVRHPVDKDKHTLDAAFATAHEWIVRGFTDLTSDQAQNKVWGRLQ
jgi:uncharacterized protein (TIGR04255 family)